MSVEPKVYDQEAKLHDLALQLPAVGSMDRHPAHHTGADGGDLCQAGARQHWRHWMAGFWQVGRAWAAWRHAHIVWKLLVSAFQWCAWICEYVTRWFACVRATAGNVRRVGHIKCVCSACSGRRAHALVCVPYAVPHCKYACSASEKSTLAQP